MNRFIFVGEEPSKKALQIGATWQNGKLAGKTLRDALLALGIDPDSQHYQNLWGDLDSFLEPETYHNNSLMIVRDWEEAGAVVVGMGKKVCTALTKAGITHIAIVHPAARGKIRKTELYQAHLAERLRGEL